jgi:hypothetical protein
MQRDTNHNVWLLTPMLLKNKQPSIKNVLRIRKSRNSRLARSRTELTSPVNSIAVIINPYSNIQIRTNDSIDIPNPRAFEIDLDCPGPMPE